MEVESSKIRFRRASVDDTEALVDYRVRFLNELYNHPDDSETDVLRKSLRKYFAEAIPSNVFVGWLAEYEDRIIGTGGMVVWQRPARYGGIESGRAGYILNFYTVPEARKKGVCTRILKELIKEARSLGLKYLHLHATEEGINIYRRAGFIEPGQTELKLRLE